MSLQPLRLSPGADLRDALVDALTAYGVTAAFVLQGIGSLSHARIRRAAEHDADDLHGDFEILTLAGSLSPDGAHLHISIADAAGRVQGGHVAAGCIVRTTAEVLLQLLPDHRFARVPDPTTGFFELEIADVPRQRTAEPTGAPALPLR